MKKERDLPFLFEYLGFMGMMVAAILGAAIIATLAPLAIAITPLVIMAASFAMLVMMTMTASFGTSDDAEIISLCVENRLG